MDVELARAGGGKRPAPEGRDAVDDVDIYRYRRRHRLFKAVVLGAALAGLTVLIMTMVEDKKNPCEKVLDHYCKKDPAGLKCKMQKDVVDESVHDSSAQMRSQIRADCQAKIERVKEDEGVEIK